MSLEQVAGCKSAGQSKWPQVAEVINAPVASSHLFQATMSGDDNKQQHNDDTMSIDWTLNMRRKCRRFFSSSKLNSNHLATTSSSIANNKCSSFNVLASQQRNDEDDDDDVAVVVESSQEGRNRQFSGAAKSTSCGRAGKEMFKLAASKSISSSAKQLISIDDLCAQDGKKQKSQEMPNGAGGWPIRVNQVVDGVQQLAHQLNGQAKSTRMIKCNSERQQVVAGRFEEIVLSMEQKQQQQQQQESDNLSALSASSSLLSQLLNSSLNQLIEIDNGSSASPMPTSGGGGGSSSNKTQHRREALSKSQNDEHRRTSSWPIQPATRAVIRPEGLQADRLNEYNNKNNSSKNCTVDERDLLVLANRRSRLPDDQLDLAADVVKLTAGRQRHLRRPPTSARSCPVATSLRQARRDHLPANSVWSLQSSLSSSSSTSSSSDSSTASPSSSSSVAHLHLDRNQVTTTTGCRLPAGVAKKNTNSDAYTNDLGRPAHFVTFDKSGRKSRDQNSDTTRKHLNLDDDDDCQQKSKNEVGGATLTTLQALCGAQQRMHLATPNGCMQQVKLESSLPDSDSIIIIKQQMECCHENCPTEASQQLISHGVNNNQHDSLLEEDGDAEEEMFSSQCIYLAAKSLAIESSMSNHMQECQLDRTEPLFSNNQRNQQTSSPSDFQCCTFCLQLDSSRLLHSHLAASDTSPTLAASQLEQTVQQRDGCPPLSGAHRRLDGGQPQVPLINDGQVEHKSRQLRPQQVSRTISSISTKSPTNSTSSSSSTSTCGIQVTTTDCSSEDSCADRRQLAVAVEQEQQQQQQQEEDCASTAKLEAAAKILTGRGGHIMGLTSSRQAATNAINQARDNKREQKEDEQVELLCKLGLCRACQTLSQHRSQHQHQHQQVEELVFSDDCEKSEFTCHQLEKSPISYLNELNNNQLVLPLARLPGDNGKLPAGEPIFGLDPRSIHRATQPSRSSNNHERLRRDQPDSDQASMVEATANLVRVVLSRDSSRASSSLTTCSSSSSQSNEPRLTGVTYTSFARPMERCFREEPIYDVPSMSLGSGSPINQQHHNQVKINRRSEKQMKIASISDDLGTTVQLRCLSPDEKYPSQRIPERSHRIIDTIKEERSSIEDSEMNLVNNGSRLAASSNHLIIKRNNCSTTKTPGKQRILLSENRQQVLPEACRCAECLQFVTTSNRRSPGPRLANRDRSVDSGKRGDNNKLLLQANPSEKIHQRRPIRGRRRSRRRRRHSWHRRRDIDQLSLISRLAIRATSHSDTVGSSATCCCWSSECCCSTCCSRSASSLSDSVVYLAAYARKQSKLNRKSNLIKKKPANWSRIGKGCCSLLKSGSMSNSCTGSRSSSGCYCSCCSGSQSNSRGSYETGASSASPSSQPGSLTEEYLRRHLPHRRRLRRRQLKKLSRRAYHLKGSTKGTRSSKVRSKGRSHSQNRHATSGCARLETALFAGNGGRSTKRNVDGANARATSHRQKSGRRDRRCGKYQLVGQVRGGGHKRWPVELVALNGSKASKVVASEASLINGEHASGAQHRKMHHLVWDDDQEPLVLKSTRRLRSISADSLERIRNANGGQQPTNVSSSLASSSPSSASASSSSSKSTDDCNSRNSMKPADPHTSRQLYKRFNANATGKTDDEEEEEVDENADDDDSTNEAEESPGQLVAEEEGFKREHRLNFHRLAHNDLDLVQVERKLRLQELARVVASNRSNEIDVTANAKSKTESNNNNNYSQQVISTGDERPTATPGRLALKRGDLVPSTGDFERLKSLRAGHWKEEANKLPDEEFRAPSAGTERDRPAVGRTSRQAKGLAQAGPLREGTNYHWHRLLAGSLLNKTSSGCSRCNVRGLRSKRHRLHSHNNHVHGHSNCKSSRLHYHHHMSSNNDSSRHHHQQRHRHRHHHQRQRQRRRSHHSGHLSRCRQNRCKSRRCACNVACRRQTTSVTRALSSAVFANGLSDNKNRLNFHRLDNDDQLCLARERQRKFIKLLDRRQKQQELERTNFKQLELARRRQFAGKAVAGRNGLRRQEIDNNNNKSGRSANSPEQLGRPSPHQLAGDRMRLIRGGRRVPTNGSHPPRRSSRLVTGSSRSGTSGCSFPTNLSASGGHRNGRANRSSVTMNQLRSMQKALIASQASPKEMRRDKQRQQQQQQQQQQRQRTLRKVVSPVGYSNAVNNLQRDNGDSNFMDRFLVKTLVHPQAKLRPSSNAFVSSSNLFGWQLARRCQCSHCCLVEKLIWLDGEAKRERRRSDRKQARAAP